MGCLGASPVGSTPYPNWGSPMASEPELSTTVGLAFERSEWLLGACDQSMVQTTLNSRAPSTRALYANRWKLDISHVMRYLTVALYLLYSGFYSPGWMVAFQLLL